MMRRVLQAVGIVSSSRSACVRSQSVTRPRSFTNDRLANSGRTPDEDSTSSSSSSSSAATGGPEGGRKRIRNLRDLLGGVADFSRLTGLFPLDSERLDAIKEQLKSQQSATATFLRQKIIDADPLKMKIVREHVSTHPNVFMNAKELQRRGDKNLVLPQGPSDFLAPFPKIPKYPIVLAHGAGGDLIPGIKYFMGIKADFEGLGMKVGQFQVENYGTITKRAGLLAKQIVEFQKQTGAEKVNIIGHSMGGLDSRHFISALGGHEITSSLLTISTPHRGSSFADWGLENLGKPVKFEVWHKSLPFDYDAYPQLTLTYLNETFNPQTPNHPEVSYYSIAGAVRMPRYHVLNWSGVVIDRLEGPNDGLVSVESAIWGKFLGTVIRDLVPLNHAEQIGWSTVIDPRPLWRKLVNTLAEEGH